MFLPCQRAIVAGFERANMEEGASSRAPSHRADPDRGAFEAHMEARSVAARDAALAEAAAESVLLMYSCLAYIYKCVSERTRSACMQTDRLRDRMLILERESAFFQAELSQVRAPPFECGLG